MDSSSFAVNNTTISQDPENSGEWDQKKERVAQNARTSSVFDLRTRPAKLSFLSFLVQLIILAVVEI